MVLLRQQPQKVTLFKVCESEIALQNVWNEDNKVFVFTEAEAALFKELWHACAGPLVTVPREGERVFYFPQGHIEQVNSVTNFVFC